VKTLIISDTHLTEQFNKRQYSFLKKIIEENDKIIINGDFWEAYFIDHKSFLSSRWDQLFKLLKSKHAVHIFGNHDNKKYMEDMLNVFATQHFQKLDIISGGYDLHIEHGHLIYSTEQSQDFSKRNQFILKLETNFGIFAEKLSMKVFPSHKYTGFVNNKIKLGRKKINIGENQILVCGHTHCPEFNLKEKFINTGMIRYGYATYLVIDDIANTIELKSARY
jgi:predicted phosphodiesterase